MLTDIVDAIYTTRILQLEAALDALLAENEELKEALDANEALVRELMKGMNDEKS